MNPDGSAKTQLSNGADDWNPNWSPDGSKIVFSTSRDPVGSSHLYTMNPDGTAETPVTTGNASDSDPAWSPDGSKIVLSSSRAGGLFEIYTINPDGTGETRLTNTSVFNLHPDWQPLSPPYPRPNGAAKTRVTLVPALEACAAPNTTHGPPLALASCAPATQRSSELLTTSDDTTRANGSITFRHFCTDGGTPPACAGSGDEADVRTLLTLNDVRCRPLPARSALTACGSVNDTPGEDYEGAVLLTVELRITDRYNGFGPSGSATMVDYDFTLGAPCTDSGSDSTTGSSCIVTTTADSLLGDMAKEDQRSIWQLGRFSVMDMGPDAQLADNPVGYAPCSYACVGTGDETPYAVQGIFIP